MLYFLFRYTPVLFLHRILVHLVIAQSIPHLKFFSTKYIKFLTNSPLVDSFFLGFVAVRHMPNQKKQLLSCKHDVAVFFGWRMADKKQFSLAMSQTHSLREFSLLRSFCLGLMSERHMPDNKSCYFYASIT